MKLRLRTADEPRNEWSALIAGVSLFVVVLIVVLAAATGGLQQ